MQTSPSDGMYTSSSYETRKPPPDKLQFFPPLDEIDEANFLKQGSDTDENWTWSDESKAAWEETTKGVDHYQKFYTEWRGASNPDFCNTFPYTLELGAYPDGKPFLPFRADSTAEGKILVTEPYDQMYHRLLRLRIKDRGDSKGAVLTGQPGIGKATFLKFMLVRLISARQVVVLCDNSQSYLFYAGKVYSRPAESGFDDVPERQDSPYFPVWALINVDHEDRVLNLASTDVWPIQTSSPNPIRWKKWCKQHGAALLGMPLWTMEELTDGLRLCPAFNTLQSRLKQFLPLPDKPTLPTTGDKTIDAMLQILKAEREKAKEEETEVEMKEDHDGMDCAGALATDRDVDMTHETSKPQAPVDKALDILVENAIEEFGLAPRDVYSGVFQPLETLDHHKDARKGLSYSKLMTFVKNFVHKRQLDNVSHHLIAVRPLELTDSRDRWTIDIKSARIGWEVVRLMQSTRIVHLLETYRSLCNILEDSTLAGWIFKALVHCMLSGGWEGSAPQFVPMVSNDNSDAPTFSTDPSSHSSPYKPRIGTIKQVKFAPDLDIPNVTLDKDKYYVPTATNDPSLTRLPSTTISTTTLS